MPCSRRDVRDPFEDELRDVRGWRWRPKERCEILQPKKGYLVVPDGPEWTEALERKLTEYEERLEKPLDYRTHSSYYVRCFLIRKLLQDGEIQLGDSLYHALREEFDGMIPSTWNEDLMVLDYYLSGREDELSGGTGFLNK